MERRRISGCGIALERKEHFDYFHLWHKAFWFGTWLVLHIRLALAVEYEELLDDKGEYVHNERLHSKIPSHLPSIVALLTLNQSRTQPPHSQPF